MIDLAHSAPARSRGMPLFNERTAPQAATIAKRAAEVFVRVSDDDFGPDIVPELSGYEGESGLLKDFGFLLNAKGEPYNSGRAYYMDDDTGELTELMVGDKQASSKADLRRALQQDPALRARAIQFVYNAIQFENSAEGIQRMIEAGSLPHDDMTVETEQGENGTEGETDANPNVQPD